jgi:hypothetical protein
MVTTMIVGIFALTAVGCGSSMGENETEVFPVSGKVRTADGKPLARVIMRFHRVPAEGVSPLEIHVEAGDTGEYTARYDGQAGIPRGKYKVTVKPGGNPQSSTYKSARMAIPAKYTDAESTPLEVDVTQANPAADLKITK